MRTTPRVHGTRGGFRLPNAPDDDARPDEVSAEHDTPPQLDAPEQEGPPAGEPKPEPKPERVAKPAPQASPLPSRDISFPTARDLGLPRRARDLYSRLADETPGDIEALAQRVQAHAITFEQESAHSEFLPLDEAKAIAAGFPTLRAASDGSPAHTRMVWIVGRYFEISDDGTPDFSIGGLDDDVAVFNAAARFLGAPSAQIEQIV